MLYFPLVYNIFHILNFFKLQRTLCLSGVKNKFQLIIEHVGEMIEVFFNLTSSFKFEI